jgi:C4-dicarboxylate-specific signal transduction histidine kinase
LDEAIKGVPLRVRPTIEQAVKRFEVARQRELRVLQDDLALYRTLGTVGTTVSVFAHESGRPVTQIVQMSGTIERRAREDLPPDIYKNHIERPLSIIQRAAAALKTYAQIPLALLQRERRQHGRVDVNAALASTVEMFQPFVLDSRITLALDLCVPPPAVLGTVASIDAIASNLITNAITALSGNDGPQRERTIQVRTEVVKDTLLLTVMDNGPGIRGIALEDIWLPGRTTKTNGTGLGLTIVRDVVDDLQGSVRATTQGALGGAEFIVALPVADGMNK